MVEVIDLAFPIRSQFLIGDSITPTAGLERLPFADVAIWADEHLERSVGPTIAVLGHAVSIDDASLDELIAGCGPALTVAEVHSFGRRLAGRFVVVAATNEGVLICPDALASKDVFMTPDARAFGSNERLLAEATGHRIEPVSAAAATLVASTAFKARESSWFGASSPMSQLIHIPPNHAAVVGQTALQPIPLQIPETPSSVQAIAATMTRIVERLGEHRPLRLGLTAGFDSRLVLAACLNASIDVSCFTFTDGNERKADDAGEASRICEALGIDFELVIEPDPADAVVADLLERSQAVTRSDRHIVAQLDWYRRTSSTQNTLTLSGMGGEISRAKFGLAPRTMGKRLTRAAALGRTSILHDLRCFDHWWEERIERAEPTHTQLPVTTQFHWEQRVGIWGSQFLGEKDLFVDEVPGFASLRLQEQLLSHPQWRRTSLRSSLFVELIEDLAPELFRLGTPVPSPTSHRIYYATPLPHVIRSLAPQSRALRASDD